MSIFVNFLDKILGSAVNFHQVRCSESWSIIQPNERQVSGLSSQSSAKLKSKSFQFIVIDNRHLDFCLNFEL